MKKDILDSIAVLIKDKFQYQDPRMPDYLKQPGKPLKRMDSPVYRIALQAVCAHNSIDRFLEIGVKKGGSLQVVLHHSQQLQKVTLCDFWTINPKKLNEKKVVESIIDQYQEQHIGIQVDFRDGSSLVTTPSLNEKYDLIGIDGSHRRDVFRSDLEQALRLVEPGGWIVIDDLVLHEDNKIDQELLLFCREHHQEIEIIYRDITNWPGAAILRHPLEKRSSLKASIGNAIANRMTPSAYLAHQSYEYTSAEIVEAVYHYIEVQDWQAMDILIELMAQQPEKAFLDALKALLKRESLEIDNQKVKHMALGIAAEHGIPIDDIEEANAINGLHWTPVGVLE